MKILKYSFLQSISHDGTPILIEKAMKWSEANESVAKAEAYNGEYTIEDDGVVEMVEPTQLDIIEAQVTYTAMMTDTLLGV